MKISELVGDLSYEEIKKRKWKHPVYFRRNGEKLVFEDYFMSYDELVIRKISSGRWNGYSGKLMKLNKTVHGYNTISLRLNNFPISRMFFHRMKWETWKGKIKIGFEINHKNGIKTDNRWKNLEEVTPMQNSRHASRNNYFRSEKSLLFNGEISIKKNSIKSLKEKRKTKTGMIYDGRLNCKIDSKKVETIRYLYYCEKFRMKFLAKKFNVSLGCINKIVQGYTHNPENLTKKELISKAKEYKIL